MPNETDDTSGKKNETDTTSGIAKTSVMFDHCKNVYNAMLERAKPVWIGDTECIVYEGRTTHLFQELRLSTPYYTRVMRDLRKMRCIEQLRRGGGSTPSQWQIIMEPDEEAYNALASDRPPNSKAEMIIQRVRSLDERVTRIEEMLGLTEGLMLEPTGTE